MPSPLFLDLRSTAVFLDFDGTVTGRDSGVHLMERLGGSGWETIDDEYRRGILGSRSCLLDEWDLLPHDEQLLRRVASEVPVDPGFGPLVGALRAAGAEVTVVSDGFGFYAEEVCARVGVPVLTNRVDWSAGRLCFPHEDRCCPCSSCGVCKQAPVRDARYRGRETVLVGDGTSDRKAALLADVVFAKGELASWCARNGIAFVPYGALDDVHAALLRSELPVEP